MNSDGSSEIIYIFDFMKHDVFFISMNLIPKIEGSDNRVV